MKYLPAMLAIVVLADTSAAQQPAVSLRGFLATDLPTRGITLSNGEPMIGATVEWDHSAGWFAGATGFTAEEGPVPDRSRGARAQLGWFGEFGRERAVEVSLAHTRFAGNFRSGWNYSEARVDLHLSRELSLSSAWSPDLQGRDVRSLAFAATWMPAIGERGFWLMSAGATHLGDSEDQWVGFGEIGVGLRLDRWQLLLQHHRVDNSTARLFFLDGRNATTLRLDYQVW